MKVLFIGGICDGEYKEMAELSSTYIVPFAPRISWADMSAADSTPPTGPPLIEVRYRLERIKAESATFYLYILQEMALPIAIERLLRCYTPALGIG